jgi:Leucine-rich repeat (LRR) protein
VFPDRLNQCKRLKILNLEGTALLGCGGLKIPSLKKLNVSKTHCNDSFQFKGMPNITDLDVSNTKINFLYGFKDLKKLNKIYISENQLLNLKKNFPKLNFRLR